MAARPAKAQGGVTSATQGRFGLRERCEPSRDRGHNGHRILRRVPDDGRHSGLSRSVTFHEVAGIAALAAPSLLRSVREGNLADGAHTRRRVHARWKRERRQECQRFDRIVRRGKKTPTLTIRTGRASGSGREVPCSMSIRRSDQGRRETPWSPVTVLWSQRLQGTSAQRKLRE